VPGGRPKRAPSGAHGTRCRRWRQTRLSGTVEVRPAGLSKRRRADRASRFNPTLRSRRKRSYGRENNTVARRATPGVTGCPPRPAMAPGGRASARLSPRPAGLSERRRADGAYHHPAFRSRPKPSCQVGRVSPAHGAPRRGLQDGRPGRQWRAPRRAVPRWGARAIPVRPCAHTEEGMRARRSPPEVPIWIGNAPRSSPTCGGSMLGRRS
jgi:hypothetical protein